MKWFALGLAALLAACSPDAAPSQVRKLDRPVDIAFGCTTSTPSGALVAEEALALPLTACSNKEGLELPTVPATTGPPLELPTPTPMGIVLQSARGEIVIANGLQGLDDGDRLSPGFNGLAVGALPVGIETTADGCWAVTANAGSCDLTTIDIESMTKLDPTGIRPRGVTLNGAPFLARPSAIVTPPALPGSESTLPDCSATPPPLGQRTAWVAYGSCRIVARIDVPTGEILDGIRFAEGQPPTLVGPSEISCPDECSAGKLPTDLDAGADAGDREPIALAFDPKGDRLYVGSLASSDLIIVGLTPGGAAKAIASVPLEGAIGLTRLAPTGVVAMGQNGAGFDHEFVYAAALDGSIHVVDVTGKPVECDTQIDRRRLTTTFDASLLACFPVGAPGNPPRRAGASGPGIRLPGDAIPLDLTTFVFNGEPDKEEFTGSPVPKNLNGTFVFASTNSSVRTGPRGVLYIINVDDDNYEDFAAEGSGTGADIALALPHTVRDAVEKRRDSVQACSTASALSALAGPPRLVAQPEKSSGPRVNFDAVPGDVLSPMLALVQCPETTLATFKLAGGAPSEVRRDLFPDLGQLPASATYTVGWEGILTLDGVLSRRPGAKVVPSGGRMDLRDDSGLVCDLGGQVRDIVSLLGCKTDADCNPGDTCYAHPDSPTGVDGMCLPKADVADLSAQCRDLLVSQRRYSVVALAANEIAMVPRPKQLESSPIEGCDSAEECTTLENAELLRRETNAGVPLNSVPRHKWACATEPTVGPGTRCLMTCSASTECSAGSICSGGRCVLGPIPPPQCLAALQRYEMRAGDSFSIVSTVTGFRSPMVEDFQTGQCVPDPTASPLLRSRFTKYEPICDPVTPTDPGDALTELEPNPCRFNGNQPLLTSGAVVATRDSAITRVRLPEITLDIADTAVPIPSIPGKTYSPLLDGYFVRFQVTAGFLPAARILSAALPVRIRRAPDNTLIVIDSGDQPDSPSVKGQVIKMAIDASEVAIPFN